MVRPEDWEPQGVDDLEDRAWEALREVNRSVCITAGAGAGKTEFLAQKAAYLLQTGLCPAPKRILAISFKRDAAATLADRVKLRCPDEQARRFVSLTFDAFTKGLVDQFRMALPEPYRPPSDYQISFPTRAILTDFFQRAEINDVNAQTLERWLSQRRLLDEAQEFPNRALEVLETYWQDQYHGGAAAYLTFPMINRLAEYLIRRNVRIRRVLRMTYPVVFLDEFQDTTRAQFELLMRAFDPATAVLTAVGDDKQRIMGWAGALPNSFELFTQHFAARPIALLLNWRSHADLVAIQHVIASRIDPDVEEAVARGQRKVDGEVSAIWQFDDKETEVNVLATWIADEVERDVMQPDEVAILVRNYADAIEEELTEAFRDRGLTLRNLARNIGEISIQDLLSEELTEILFPFLQLGATRRNSAAWSNAQDIMRRLESPLEEDEVALQRLSDKAAEIARASRSYMAHHAAEPGRARPLIGELIDLIDERTIRQSTPSYHRQADYDRVREGLILLLDEVLLDADDWQDALDRFEGRGQVPLMTIHKSKGMEFHTMIFLGLDNQSWWSLKPNAGEELNSFFVAFTRAKQRAFFSSCAERGGQIAWLENLLGNAVPRVDGDELA
jgi:superfamily I DNA/RNA helicase